MYKGDEAPDLQELYKCPGGCLEIAVVQWNVFRPAQRWVVLPDWLCQGRSSARSAAQWSALPPL